MSDPSDHPFTVWILNHSAHPRDVPGISRHHDFGAELVRRGNHVVVFSSSFDSYSHKYTRQVPSTGWSIEAVDGIKWVWLWTCAYFRNDARRVLGMVQFKSRVERAAIRLLRLHQLPRPDVIVGSTVHPLAAQAGANLARALGCPFVFEVRDLWPETLIDMGALRRTGLPARLLAGLEKRLCQESSGIIIVPDRAGDYFFQRGVPKEKIIWIPNSVDLKRYVVPGTEDRLHDGTFSVVYMGALGANDGMRNAIEAWTELERRGFLNIRLSLYGDGNEKAELMRLSESRHLTSVSFCERVPKDQVPAILDAADAALMCALNLPLYRYGVSPNKLADYMAASKPVICSSGWPITALDSSGCAIRCAAEDPLALADAVLQMRAKSNVERAAMGRAGRLYAERVLGVQEVGVRLEAGLRRVIEGRAIADDVVSDAPHAGSSRNPS